MYKKLLISVLGMGLLLSACSEDKNDSPVSEETITENATNEIEGVVESFSSEEQMIKVNGETYDVSRIEDIDELKSAEEIKIEFVTEDNINYATNFKVLKTKSTAVETPVTQEANGTFVGFADTNSVAINVDGEELIYQTSWIENEDELTNITENDTLNFEYVEENDVLYITKVLIGEQSSVAELYGKGTFIGYADNHTVMIEEEGTEVSYQTT
ncbi:MAG: hypothetical protein ACK5KP_00990, partial [Paludibacteraceae bacterium]